MRCFRLCPVLLAAAAVSFCSFSLAQNETPMPRDYRGVQTYIPGIYVTPVPNAPFAAKVEIISHDLLPDGTVNIRTTINHIARSSSGRIYNERRRLVPVNFKGDHALLSGHIYDPSSRLNPFFKQEDIGTQPLGGLTLTGIRKTHIIPAAASTTGKDIVIIDEYWYSPDLAVYMIIKHNDPRTGEQIVAITDVERHEPEASLFVVPHTYKVVDETPPAQ
jgi:hypothetical protein